MVSSLILPKHAKTREPKVSIGYHGAQIYIYICNTLPLDNPKTHSHLALPYITWGLIWDLKNKIQRDPN